MTAPQPLPTGERYIWNIEDAFGPLYLSVDYCVGGLKPRVFFTVHLPGGKTRQITRSLPLPAHSEFLYRHDWTDVDLENALEII